MATEDTGSICNFSRMGPQSAERWWSEDTVAVVTGGNKGIGFEIVKQLAQNGITTVLTSRDVQRGEGAVKKLVAEGLPVVYHQLDVASAESALKLADWLKQQYGAVDILVNNAAYFDPVVDSAEISFNTNFYGVKHVTNSIFPLLRQSEAGARVLVVSSRVGLLQYLGKDTVRQTLSNVDDLSEDKLDELIQAYYADVEQQKGSSWFPHNYGLTKVFLNAYVRLLAKQLAGRPAGQKIFVNSFCPGYTTTDGADAFVGKFGHLLPPDAVFHGPDVAAEAAVWLTLLPASDLPSGIFSTETRERLAF